MTIRRREMLGMALAAAAAPQRALAQVGRPRLVAAIIGARGVDDPNGPLWAAAISQGLAGEGWFEGSNVHLEARFAVADPVLAGAHAAELLALRPDVFVGGTTENAVAIHALTQTIPLLFTAVSDPVGLGLVASFNRPGGHATGVVNIEATTTGKFLSILLDIAPDIRQVGFAYSPLHTINLEPQRTYFLAAAQAAGVEPVDVPMAEAEDIGPAVDAFAAVPNRGLVLSIGSWLLIHRAALIAAVNRNGLPTVYSSVAYATDGGIVAYAPDTTEAFRRVGGYAGRILNGASPADLPVQSPGYLLVVNLKAAAAQGVTVPATILVAADRVIE